MSVRGLARCAFMTAALIIVQYALGFVSGVELVTVVFAAFCYTDGIRSGIMTAVSFSLLRCFIYGFMPNVILLYIVYYTLFAVCFGAFSEIRPSMTFLCVFLGTAAALCAFLGIRGIGSSGMGIAAIKVMFFILSGIFAVLLGICIGVSVKKNSAKADEIAEKTAAAALAAVMTVCFTLLDDFITPFVFGYSAVAAKAYFYGSFAAMLPQTICAAVSVFLLFPYLKKAFAGAN